MVGVQETEKQTNLNMTCQILKIDNEKFRKVAALLYSFGECSILDDG